MCIRRHGWLYVDKTRFLRRLEQERYAFLIRPRRFGKSLWVSLLELYYDRFWGREFDATFGGTDIGRSPTEERSRYVRHRRQPGVLPWRHGSVSFLRRRTAA